MIDLPFNSSGAVSRFSSESHIILLSTQIHYLPLSILTPPSEAVDMSVWGTLDVTAAISAGVDSNLLPCEHTQQ